MKNGLWIVLIVFATHSTAQERIYRCGNEYTNTLPSAQTKGCKLVAGGNVTVVKGRVDSAEQKSRDSDVRQILESELKKAQARQGELQQEYNNGQPEKLGSETRNYQKYLDRVAQLKASLERNESDIAGLRREIARLGQAAAAPPVR